MSEALKLGHLPSLTWNRLKMNEGKLEEFPESLAASLFSQSSDTETVPEGISLREITREEADALIGEYAPAQKQEKYVAGKMPIYHPQKFATGLGAEFEQLLEKAENRVQLFETEEGMKAEEPLVWTTCPADGSSTAMEQIIHLRADSSLTLVMNYTSEKEAEGFLAVSTRVILEKGARLVLAKSQLLSEKFVHADDMGAGLEEEASLKLVVMELGGRNVFLGINTDLAGRSASFENIGGYLVREDHQLDMTVNSVHRGKRSESKIVYEGILADRGRKILRDTIDFRAGAAGAAGDEQENVLLLDPEVDNKSMPVILCEEENMEGRHGASIGRLGQDMLFYLSARGIDEKAAEQMMVRAKLLAVSGQIPDTGTQELIQNFIEETYRDESIS